MPRQRIMSSGIRAFGAMLDGTGNILVTVGKALALRCQVPYHENREVEKLMGHRRTKILMGGIRKGPGGPSEDELEGPLLSTREFRFPTGELLQTNEWPKRIFDEHAEQLTEEVWTHDHGPDSHNDVQEAVQKCAHGITGVYYHRPSMNLVLVSASGKKIGIRSTALVIPLIGLKQADARLLGRLKKAASA
jgi:hypothetical protein